MKLRKVFRFRMQPNAAQQEALSRTAGARRFVWNWALAQRRAYYQENHQGLPGAELSLRLTALKQHPETTWLQEVNAQAMQQVLFDLQRAFTNFFEKRARFPKFKSRKRDTARFRMPQQVRVADSQVYVPKVGWIRIHQSQPVDGETKSATFKRDATGHWDVSVVTEFTMPDTPLMPADPAKVVGVDLGLRDFATFSDGSVPVPAPQFFRRQARKLRRAQRVLSRRQTGSARRARAKHAVARVPAQTANQRSDFIHNLTTQLVREHDGLCIEDLSVKGLAKTKLAKSIHDASFGEFRRHLEYKTVWNRRHLAVIDRFFPSSKTCQVCGAVNDTLTLANRIWTCGICGSVHRRDLNAAWNIRAEGLKLIPVAAGHAETLNARGAGVRPPQGEAVGVEA